MRGEKGLFKQINPNQKNVAIDLVFQYTGLGILLTIFVKIFILSYIHFFSRT